MRVMVTGSRDWTNTTLITNELTAVLQSKEFKRSKGPVVLVSGACRTGADAIAEKVWHSFGLDVEQHPAKWNELGLYAGLVRNQEMVESGVDLCLAFIKNNSKGASHALRLAEEAGVKTIVWREDRAVPERKGAPHEHHQGQEG